MSIVCFLYQLETRERGTVNARPQGITHVEARKKPFSYMLLKLNVRLLLKQAVLLKRFAETVPSLVGR